jgi:hypothetical protein
VVYLVYQSMSQAVLDMGGQLRQGTTPASLENDPTVSPLLHRSYVIGYWGHNVYINGQRRNRLEELPYVGDGLPRGVFMVGCETARWFPEKYLPSGTPIEPLLFTRTLMAPEAYSALALYDSLGRGVTDKDEIVLSVAKAYNAYQNRFNKSERPKPLSLSADLRTFTADRAEILQLGAESR